MDKEEEFFKRNFPQNYKRLNYLDYEGVNQNIIFEAMQQYAEREIKPLIELLKMAKCPNCDGSGAIAHKIAVSKIAPDPNTGEPIMISDEDIDFEQCQWCYERDKYI